MSEPAYRADGWPLCPVCGEDELYSLIALSLARQATAIDPMRCYRCHWSGQVPARPVDELRPGVRAEFADPRDRFSPTAIIAKIRAQLRGSA